MEELQAQMNEKLTELMDEVRSLSEALKTVKRENEQLKNTVSKQADEIAELRNDLNDRELHARSWSIRVLNLPIPAGRESDNKTVMETVYREMVVPILEGAKASGEIQEIPPCHNIIEVAHILPGKNSNKPVIVRFFSRYWRSLLFRFRRDHAPREGPTTDAAGGGPAASRRPPKMRFPFYEDLTRATFKQLMRIQQHEEVVSAWTVSGVIRFKVKNKESVYKVTCVYDTVEDLVD
jgi:hypothetical protein